MKLSNEQYAALEAEADALFAEHGGVFTNYEFSTP